MEKNLITSILPTKQQFAKINAINDLHLEAICIFAASGFFMDGDTYWKDQVCLLPAHNHSLDQNGLLIKSTPRFEWHYSPNQLSFDHTLEAYVALLTQITKEQIGDQPVILPLSGGLDSRSQALVLKDLPNPVQAFSYYFKGGYPEHHIAKRIAAVCGFEFASYQIPQGYLWNCIDELAQINQCYSEFTHPRQMAVLPKLKQMTGVFSLGHWGDVLFDRGAPEGTTEAGIIPLLFKKMVKPKGLELAQHLWQAWGLAGNFKDYLISRIEADLAVIDIVNVSAKVRAYKTSQWAHRWTTTNLKVFEAAHPITLPYYDDRMIQFICTVPEAHLADRRLQLAHLRQHKELAQITWHAEKPFNLINCKYNKAPYNMPYRVLNKLQRKAQEVLGNPYIQRNWELQFLGEANECALKRYVFDSEFNNFIPKEMVQEVYEHFKKTDAIHYAHPLSMLLTLSVWYKNNVTAL